MSFARFFSDVAEFHREMGFFPFSTIDPESKIVTDTIDDLGQLETSTKTFAQAVADKRCRIIREEAEELCEAIELGDKSKILHEGVDLLYVTLGAFLQAGITWAEISVGWSLIQIANLGKDAPSDPLDKAVKGDRFEAADMSKALGSEGEVHTYAIVCGSDENAKAMVVNTIGPMDRSDWLGLVRESVEKVGRLPTVIRELL